MKHKLHSLLLSFGLFCASAGIAQADSLLVRLPVIDPSGNPVEGVPGTLYQGDTYADYTTTNSVGYANYYGTTDGTSYTINLNPSAATCTGCSLYNGTEVDFTADLDAATYDPSSGYFIQLLDTVQLTQATRYITVTVVDDTGAPVEGINVYGWTDAGDYAYGTTNSAGQYQFAVETDNTEEWSVGAYPSDGGYTSDYEYDLEVSATGETAVQLSVVEADSAINLSFLDADGGTFTVPTDAYGSVYCYDNTSYTYYFYGTLTGGDTAASLEVVSGYTYQCALWLDGYASSGATVTVSDATPVNANLTIVERDAEIQFQYVDTDGNVITTLDDFYAYASSTKDATGADNYSDYAYEHGAAGEATLSVVGGYTYQVSGYFVTAVSGVIRIATVTYVNSYQSVEVVADSSAVQTVQITLQEADAAIQVTVLNSEGDAPNYGYVTAWQESADEHTWGTYVGAQTDSDGVATLNVTSGATYHVYAYTSDSYTAGTIPPPEQTATPAVGETVELTMQSLESDFTLTVHTTIEATPEYSYCYAYNPSLGMNTYATVTENTGTLYLMRGSTWYVGCMAYAGEDFYWAFDERYTPASGESEDSLNMTLQSAGAYYPETSYTFSATAASTITLPDGVSTLTIPANAIADSGNVTIIVKTGTGYSVNENSFPISVYEFTALDDLGNTVTEFSSNLTLNLYYDEALLADLDLTEDDLLGAAYDGDNSQWEAPTSTTVDTENNIITISLSHFSLYGGVTTRTVNSVPTKPVHVRVHDRTRHKATVDWRKGTGRVRTYRLQVRKQGKPNTAVLYRGIERSEKRLKDLVANTDYQARIKACNAQGCSGFTVWKRFSTR